MRVLRNSGKALVVLAALAAAACDCNGSPGEDAGTGGGAGGGDGGGAGGGGGGGVTPFDGGALAFCTARAATACDRDRACTYLDQAQESTCRARVEAACAREVARAGLGTSQFDAVSAAECLASLGAARCIEGPLVAPAECGFHRVFRPAFGNGTNCAETGDCGAGFCFGGLYACRTCRAWLAAGEACSVNDRQCNPASSFCGLNPDGGVDVCRALLADGQPCGANRQCATAWCNWRGNVPDAGPDVCGRVPVGGACGDAEDCVSGAWCQGFWTDGRVVVPGVCAARIALGQPCANHSQDDGCAGGATCLGGVCRAVTPYSLGAGAECEGLSDCAEPFYCRGFEALQADGGPALRSGVCAARLDAGGPCGFATYVDTDCVQAATCGASDTCVLRSGSGGACAASWECRDFLSCPTASGACLPYQPTGEACGDGVRCAEGATDGRCAVDGGAGVCLPKLAAGEPCSTIQPWDCASGQCLGVDGGAPVCQVACLP